MQYYREKGVNKYQHEWISDKDTLEEKSKFQNNHVWVLFIKVKDL